jgi:outer membrane protein assembly factor BamB
VVLASDWYHFLGPDAQSAVASGKLPREWSETSNVRWFTPTQGLGWSSPVIANDRIYFTTAVPEGEQSRLFLVCHDVKTGEELFSKPVFLLDEEALRIHSKNSHASPTPWIEGDRIYLHFGHHGTACADLDGNIQWSSTKHAYSPVHGNGSSPIVVDGLLVMTCDGADEPFTLALDTKSGEEVWRTPRGIEASRTFSFCTPSVIEVAGNKQIISVGSDIVQSLNPANGKVNWFVRYEGYSIIPRPLYHQGLVFISTGYDSPKLIAIDPTGQGDVTESHVRWKHTRGVSNTPSFVAVEDCVVLVSDNGIASALEATTGKERWKKRLGGNYSASPLRDGSVVYFQSEAGDAFVVDFADIDQPKELAKNSLPGRIFASYAVYENDLVIRTESGLYRIGQK